MVKRVVAGTSVAAAAVAAVGAGGAPAQAASVRVVHPGESIQAAVDAAAPGDTVLVLPGTYRGSVQISKPRVTLRGTGAGITVLAPATTASDPQSTTGPANPATNPATNSAINPATNPDTGNATSTSTSTSAVACAAAGDGLCVTGADGVRVESLTVTGFAKYGIWATSADRLTVDHVRADANGQYGIGQEKSIRSRFTSNEASGNGEAGLFVANAVSEEGGATDTQGTEIRGNALTGNHMGLVVRRLRRVTVDANTISGNCAGVFLVGDENTPRAGEMTVTGNKVDANNAYCAATARLPYVQGSGIVLTGVENTLVSGNEVTGNVGASPLSGGVVLFPSFTGKPDSGNTVRNNTLLHNGPADLADRDHGTGNTFTANECQVSLPAGHC
ncbi:right-handed parallel beta-helix repeat-containing protein [Streptomyces sp. NBC_00669]|uniref:right-handed parallel beta-helix repeat-containing protein n=1 Tax=Streptomyces sp. NBC_00669 TaxID=2976011 RepID=UPI003FA6BBBF